MNVYRIIDKPTWDGQPLVQPQWRPTWWPFWMKIGPWDQVRREEAELRILWHAGGKQPLGPSPAPKGAA